MLKGGTMISVPQFMQPRHTKRFTSDGIECVATTLSLHDATYIQVVLLYRSPAILLQQLIIMLSRVLNSVLIANISTIVLGDFNYNILSQLDSQIVSLMSAHGFIQLVNTPTTASGTLIDHVYYNKAAVFLLKPMTLTIVTMILYNNCSIPIHPQ